MKRLLLTCICIFMLSSLLACGKNDVSRVKNEKDTAQGIENISESGNAETESTTETTEKNVENISEEVEDIAVESEKNTDKIQEDVVITSDSTSNSDEKYTGEYYAYDIDEPGLQIQGNGDGTYKIQIGIYRLIQLDECVGQRTEKGLVFSTKELGDKDICGIITIEDDVATVTFTGSDWSTYSEINEYKYYKTSDEPHIYEP